jgi:hypothetical protein
VAVKRIYVDEAVEPKYTALLLKEVAALKQGFDWTTRPSPWLHDNRERGQGVEPRCPGLGAGGAVLFGKGRSARAASSSLRC